MAYPVQNDRTTPRFEHYHDNEIAIVYKIDMND